MSRFKLTNQVQTAPIVAPGYVRGFASAQSPFALPAGMMPYLQNIRLDDSVCAARPGSVKMTSARVGTGSFRGWFEGTLDGAPFVWMAFASASLVTIFQSADGGVTWTNISPTAGPFGDTRLTDTGNPVSFSIVTDRGALGATQHDCLVIQSGVDMPRVYAKAADTSTAFTAGDFGMAVVDQPAIPTGASVTIGCKSQSNIALTTGTSSGSGTFTWSHPFIGFFSETNASTAGDYLTLTLPAPLDLSASQQIIFETGLFAGFSTGNPLPSTVSIQVPSPFDYKIEISDGTHDVVIWDPQGGSAALSFYVDAGQISNQSGEMYYICCPTSQMGSSINLAAITTVKLTLLVKHIVSTGPAWSITNALYAIMASGNVQYGAGFTVGYGASDARSVGPTTDLSTVHYALDMYGFAAANPPADDRVYVEYQITANGPPAPEEALGVDLIQIYAQLTGQTGYYLIDVVRYATWTGSAWSTTLSFPIVISSITEQDFLHPDPQASALVCPMGTTLETANSRLFVGSGSTFWYSVFENPFLFYQTIVTQVSTGQLDPSSGASRSFDGETIQRITGMGAAAGPTEAAGSPITVTATVIVHTDQNLYQVAGFDALSLNKALPYGPHGTLSPMSVARYQNRLYWLDQTGQICVFSGWQAKQISLEIVDDQTLAIPGSRLPWVVGCCLNGRYYMAYSAAGGSTNTLCLVYSEVRQMFESIDIPAGYTMEGLLAYYDKPNNALRLLAADSTGFVIEHARPNNTAGDLGTSGVAFEVKSEYIHGPTYTEFAIIRDVGVMCDSVTDGTLTTSRLSLDRPTPYTDPGTNYDPNPAVGTIDIDGGPGYPIVQQWDMNAVNTTSQAVGIEGSTVQLTLSGTVPGCWKLYALLAKLTIKPDSMARP